MKTYGFQDNLLSSSYPRSFLATLPLIVFKDYHYEISDDNED